MIGQRRQRTAQRMARQLERPGQLRHDGRRPQRAHRQQGLRRHLRRGVFGHHRADQRRRIDEPLRLHLVQRVRARVELGIGSRLTGSGPLAGGRGGGRRSRRFVRQLLRRHHIAQFGVAAPPDVAVLAALLLDDEPLESRAPRRRRQRRQRGHGCTVDGAPAGVAVDQRHHAIAQHDRRQQRRPRRFCDRARSSAAALDGSSPSLPKNGARPSTTAFHPAAPAMAIDTSVTWAVGTHSGPSASRPMACSPLLMVNSAANGSCERAPLHNKVKMASRSAASPILAAPSSMLSSAGSGSGSSGKTVRCARSRRAPRGR